MSQNWQQPPQQPQQQPGGYGYPQYGQPPQQQPYGGGPQYGGGFPPPPPPGRQGNAGLAIAAAAVVAAIGGILYAFLLSAMSDTEANPPEITQFGYAGVIVGALVGVAVAKLGGRNPALWVIGAALALAAAMFGELYGYALISSDLAGNYAEAMGASSSDAPSANSIFFEQFGDLFDAWKEEADALTFIFVGVAPVAALSTAYRLGNR